MRGNFEQNLRRCPHYGREEIENGGFIVKTHLNHPRQLYEGGIKDISQFGFVLAEDSITEITRSLRRHRFREALRMKSCLFQGSSFILGTLPPSKQGLREACIDTCYTCQEEETEGSGKSTDKYFFEFINSVNSCFNFVDIC